MDQPFIPGLTLSQYLFDEAVRPILAKHFPSLAYSAALIGPGSDVLGFDTPQSTDHDWGPRLLLFLADADVEMYRPQIERALHEELPPEIHGFPIDMTWVYRSGHDGQQQPGGDKVHHGVAIHSLRAWVQQILGIEMDAKWTAGDWLTFTEQHLRSLTSGRVFHDGLGELGALRTRLSYYPREVWLYLLAAQWQRIGQEEPFMGRCGQVGDELGSRLVAARLVRDVMRLCFLMECKYAPYIKWFGTAFRQLDCAAQLSPVLDQVLTAETWQERQPPLVAAYEFLAGWHNRLGITPPLEAKATSFFNRPFWVIQADRFAQAIWDVIADEAVRGLPQFLGSIDQFTDSTDALNFYQRIKRIF